MRLLSDLSDEKADLVSSGNLLGFMVPFFRSQILYSTKTSVIHEVVNHMSMRN